MHLTRTLINEIVRETCILGPVAAMYGREFQQFLLDKGEKTTIPVGEMDFSVNSGRASLSDKKIDALTKELVTPSTWGKNSPEPARTRTPQRGKGQQSRAPWKDTVRSPHPAYHRDDPVRSDYDARYMDIRYRADYHRLQQEKDRLREQDRLQREQDRLRQQERIRDRQDRSRRAQYGGRKEGERER